MTHFPISYIGNKRNDIKHFSEFLPSIGTYDTILEPFAGSGAMSNHLSNTVDKIILNDINPLVVDIYRKWIDGHNVFSEWANQPDIKKQLRKLTGNVGKTKISKNTKARELFRDQLIEKGILLEMDWKEAVDKYSNERTFIFLDPPYFDSDNRGYIRTTDNSQTASGQSIIDIVDNTRMFIDILELLKTSPAKVMLIINKNAITEFIYKDYIVGEYIKIYSRSIYFNGNVYRKRTKHLIITNY